MLVMQTVEGFYPMGLWEESRRLEHEPVARGLDMIKLSPSLLCTVDKNIHLSRRPNGIAASSPPVIMEITAALNGCAVPTRVRPSLGGQ
ncbi:hypothetical protein J6590_079033 [Homalodisca vitripennis]|nr:hypothetical protein J6590_079033 [Homalodisca vitripennis]